MHCAHSAVEDFFMQMPRWIIITLLLLLIILLVFLILRWTGKTERHIETSVLIYAPAERVWAVFTDFEAYPGWSAPMRFDTAPQQTGQQISFHNADDQGKKDKTITPTVLEMTPNTALRWKGRLLLPGIFDGEHYFTLSPQPDGGTLFTQGEHFSGILIPFTGGLLNDTEQNFHRFNQALKGQAEAGE